MSEGDLRRMANHIAHFDVRQINPTGKSPKSVQPLGEKYSAFAVGQISASTPAVSRPPEGRFAIVTKRWARDAVDALASGTII
jgi:hypothetical protein